MKRMKKTISVASSIATLTFLGPSALYAQDKAARPAIFQELINCRSIPDSSARLACYDKQVAGLDEAEKLQQVVIVDKAQVTEARRGLFGLSLSGLTGIFGGGNNGDREGLQEITSSLKSVNSIGYGKWRFVLADDAVWVTTEAMTGRAPKRDAAITIKRGSLGSFTLYIDGARPVKGKREN